MRIHEAIELVRDAVGGGPGVWADFGAGTGTFTRALAETLGSGSTIYAIDADPGAVAVLRNLQTSSHVRIVPVQADFTRPFALPGLSGAPLDGILLANALHFVRDAADVLTDLVGQVRAGGRVVLVEYDRREASRWVPYPIPASVWPRLAAAAGLTGSAITATRPSTYSGILYVGSATKP